jgi:hypothetical protein
MAQGRPKKSESLNKLHGNPGKRKSTKQTLDQSGCKLGLPRGLGKTVQRHCSAYAKYLIKSGIPIDLIRAQFERYCKHLQLSSDAYRDGDQKIFDTHSNTALRIEKQFESMLKNNIMPVKKESALDAFRAKGSKLQVVKK